MTVGYYKCVGSKTDRNKKYAIHVLLNVVDWPETVLRQRCLLGNRFFMRPADAEEERTVTGNRRAVSYCYENIEQLLEDERNIVSPDQLTQIKAAYEQFGHGEGKP